MLTTGMEWEAGIFFEAFKILSKRLGKDEARKILGKVMYNAGYKLGSEARKLVDNIIHKFIRNSYCSVSYRAYFPL